jgi:hypothetical protein
MWAIMVFAASVESARLDDCSMNHEQKGMERSIRYPDYVAFECISQPIEMRYIGSFSFLSFLCIS